MHTLKVKPLDHESFRRYGDYVQLLHPASFYGDAQVTFTPDMLQLTCSNHGQMSYSICRVVKRDMVVTTSEFHTAAAEGNIPLDGDIVVHVAPANGTGEINPDAFEAFLIPKGTLVTFKAGVWHFAPYAVSGEVSTLVILPERTYANDCIVKKHTQEQLLKIEL